MTTWQEPVGKAEGKLMRVKIPVLAQEWCTAQTQGALSVCGGF